MTIIWYMVPETLSVTDRIFVILDHFLPFYFPNNPKNQNFQKKKKKAPGDIISLPKCTENHNHMLDCSWDMTRDGCNFYFSFWAIFLPKNQNLKKWKKKTSGDIIILHMCTKNYDHMMHGSWDRCTTDGWTEGRKKWYIMEGAPPIYSNYYL